MSLIYQYTSLETLALILANRTIKFNNLCNLDDPLEKYIKIQKLGNHHLEHKRENLGRYCFVSCWTRKKDESIAMWDMYGDRKRGVRIGLPIDMFESINELYSHPVMKQRALFSTTPTQKNVKPDFIDVVYDRIDDPTILSGDWTIDIGNLGKYKIAEWAFQEECRFRIYATVNDCGAKSYFVPSQLTSFPTIQISNPIDDDSLFLKINNDALSQIEIKAGPDMTEGNTILLNALLDKYGVDHSRFSMSNLPHKND